MEKVRCDRCGQEYSDPKDVDACKAGEEGWKALCAKDGDVARGLAPCPNLKCQGELVLVT